MSSLSAIGQLPTQVSGLEPTTSESPPPAPYLQGTLNGVSEMVSLPPGDVRSALKQGSSISDLAAQSGVSRDSVVQYIEQQVQSQRSSQGQAPIDPATLNHVVSSAVDRRRGGRSGGSSAQASSPQTTATTSPTTTVSFVDLLG